MNKKGFTLVELLAVIIILSIIVLITAISTSNIIRNSKKSLSDIQINSIKESAKSYYIEEGNNQNYVCVNVSELISKGYIDNENKNNEEMAGSVKIRYIDNKYIYEYKSYECVKCIINMQNSNKYSVGDIVTCDLSESIDKFYIIEEQPLTATKVQMLTEKNIHKTEFRQSDKAGTIEFSSRSYWGSETTYPVDVYDERNDTIKPIVDEYVSYFELEGITGSLLTLSQAINLGCKTVDSSYGSCSSAPRWLQSTTYWLGSACTSTSLWDINPTNLNSGHYSWDEYYGVRPVITIPTSNLKQNE